MKKISNSNIFKCDCGELLKVRSYTYLFCKLLLLILAANIILSFFTFGFFTKTVFFYILGYVEVVIIFCIVVSLVKGGGHCKCKRCSSTYKFSRYEYTNKIFDGKTNYDKRTL